MSVRFEEARSYQDLKSQGPRVIPFLVEDLRQQPQGSWWRIQMVDTYAANTLGQPIDFPEAIRGRLGPVKETVVEWWETTGRVAYVLLEPELAAREVPSFD